MPAESDVDVAVRLGEVPAHLSGPSLLAAACEASPQEFLLRVEGVAYYHARAGSQVTVQPHPEALLLDIRTYLLSSIFAALCHQRALLPLHASAVETPRGVIAFLGRSGAGKSSLAAFLGRRGYRIVADDICLIDPAATLSQRVLPVAPWLKLWRDTLDVLGTSPDPLHRTFSTDDKYRLTLDGSPSPLPLAELILLPPPALPPPERALTGGQPHPLLLERLSPAGAIHSVMEMISQTWLVTETGQTAAYFTRCGKALEGARVYSLARDWGFDHMDPVLDALEQHFTESAG